MVVARRVRPIYRAIREDKSEVEGRVGETFGGIRVVRAFRRERWEERAYAVGHHSALRKELFAHRRELVFVDVVGSRRWGRLERAMTDRIREFLRNRRDDGLDTEPWAPASTKC
jgi:ABC-type multidrug transport system fused ATPase/permease subunit